MASVKTLRALLVDALQDLYEGEVLTRTHLPALIQAADAAPFIETLRDRLAASHTREASLEKLAQALGEKPHGPRNLWMSAMFEDARRDMHTVEKGPLLDAALVGAVRKMTVAALVSYETAMAVADLLGSQDHAAVFRRARDQERIADNNLRSCLTAVVAANAAG